MNDTFDPWALASGLMDDIDVTINAAYFAFDDQYNNGETLLLKLEVTTDDDDNPEDTLMYPVGAGWEPKNKGAEAAREDGRDRSFGKNSGYGLLITAAIEAGAGDALGASGEGDPRTAAIWQGLTFHMKRKVISYGGEIGDKERLLPTEFKGKKGAAKAGGAAKKATGAAKKASGKAAVAEDDGDDAAEVEAPKLSGALKVKLIKAAKANDTHDAFMEAAYEIDGVDGNEAAEAAVADDSDTGLWASNQE